MNARMESTEPEGGSGAAPLALLQYSPNSFLKLILLGFALIGLPLISVLIYSVVSIDQLADHSRKTVYQAAQIAHGSRVLVDEIATMERSVQQTLILADVSLLEGYFHAHKNFEGTVASLFELSPRTEQKQSLQRLQLSESAIFHKISAVRQTPEELRGLTGGFTPLLDSAQTFSTAGYALIELKVSEMQAMTEHAHSIVKWQLLALIPVMILLAFTFSVIVARPIRQIDEAIRNMGQGDLSQVIRVDGPKDLKYLGKRLDWMRRRFLELEEQKIRFLQHVSHELKTPLTAMREGADLLAEGVVGKLTEKQQQVANILHSNSKQLQKRIEDLLNYSALQTEKFTLVKQRANLAVIVSAVLQDHNLATMNKGLKIDLACPELTLDCDELKIRTIVDNLLSNAVKFSPPDGCIKIRASKVGESIQLDVTDAGAGVDETDGDKVFEPFYQGRRVPGSPIRGTGLGLAIAREYALTHGGNIELVQQTAAGAHFRLTLTIHDPENVS